MFFAKTLVALTAAAFVAASPMARSATDAVQCYFIATPNPELSSDALYQSIQTAIGRTISNHFNQASHIYKLDDLVRHNDGTYDVNAVVDAQNVANADVAAFVNSWAGETLTEDANVEWAIGAANCK